MFYEKIALLIRRWAMEPGNQIKKHRGGSGLLQEGMLPGLEFIAFSMIGWIYEVCIMYFEMHAGFVNRGFMYGPWLPLYGFGGMLIILLFGKLRDKKLRIGKIPLAPAVCFILICLLSTVVELAASYIVEYVTGHTLWDYRNAGYGPTFEGRIALRSSLQFGLIGMAVLYCVQPLIEKGLKWLKEKSNLAYCIMGISVIGIFAIDLVYHLIFGSNALR